MGRMKYAWSDFTGSHKQMARVVLSVPSSPSRASIDITDREADFVSITVRGRPKDVQYAVARIETIVRIIEDDSESKS